jgi:hypothetical protein
MELNPGQEEPSGNTPSIVFPKIDSSLCSGKQIDYLLKGARLLPYNGEETHNMIEVEGE